MQQKHLKIYKYIGIISTDTCDSISKWTEIEGTAGFLKLANNNVNCLNNGNCIELTPVTSGAQTIKVTKSYSEAVNYLSAILRFRIRLVIITLHETTIDSILYEWSCDGTSNYINYDGVLQVNRPINVLNTTWDDIRIDIGSNCNLKIQFTVYLVGGSDSVYLDHFQFIGDTNAPSLTPTEITNTPTKLGPYEVNVSIYSNGLMCFRFWKVFFV